MAAFLKPEHARIEVKGPLGVSVALIQMDPQFLQLFIPREKTVYRFPTPELYKNNARRDAFLALLPVPIYPDIFMDAILTISQLPEKMQACRYEDSENLYSFSVKDKEGEGGKWVDLDPNSYFPLKVSYFDKKFPLSKKAPEWRPTHELIFEKWDGSGLATIPTHISLFKGKEKLFQYVWKEAESWKDYDEKSFEWRPSASVKIKDY
ncbi:MAG: hypothetical protein KA116_05225 [Proteobacteria bacterium]|nr:hypothetical protein [Pseudomonadota bacterium]